MTNRKIRFANQNKSQKKEITDTDQSLTPAYKDCIRRARKIATERIAETYVQIWLNNSYDKKWNRVHSKKGDLVHPNSVLPLVLRSIQHLDCYSRTVNEFAYININDARFPLKIVLQEKIERQTLNVVIEVHFSDIKTMQLVVIAATSHYNFTIKNDQYFIVFEGLKSRLMKQENGTARFLGAI